MDSYARILQTLEALYPSASPELLSAAARTQVAADLMTACTKMHSAQIIDFQARRRNRQKAGAL